LHRVRKEPETIHKNNAKKVSESSSLCSMEFWVLLLGFESAAESLRSFLKELLKTQNPKLKTQN
jgi:hypothetical protein